MSLSVKAIVQKLVMNGKHGAYAVATVEEVEGSITFSLEPTVWLEKQYPEEGEFVLLADIRKKRAGWRAKKGRFWRLSDEQSKQKETIERSKT